MTASPHAPETITQLAAMSRALASVVRGAMGLTADDLLSCGWLGYVSAAERGIGHPGCMARARGAMLDAMRTWDGLPYCHKTGQRIAFGVALPDTEAFVPVAPQRSRLPRVVRRALQSLSLAERTALHLWTVRGWDHALIARHLQIPEGTSASLRHRAIKKLRAVVGVSRDRPRQRIERVHGSASVVAPTHTARTLSNRDGAV